MSDSISNGSGSELSMVAAVVTSGRVWDTGEGGRAIGWLSRSGASALRRLKFIEANLTLAYDRRVKSRKLSAGAPSCEASLCSHCHFDRLAPSEQPRRHASDRPCCAGRPQRSPFEPTDQ